MGHKDGVAIFSVGFESASTPVIRAVKNLFSLGDCSIDNITYVDTRPVINTWMIAGGIISRLLGLTFIGRPLVIRGTQLAYTKIVSLVEGVEAGLRKKTR